MTLARLLAGITALLLLGVRRAFAPDRPKPRRSKIAGAILTVLSVAVFGFFIFATFINARRLPASAGAPQVGRKAPDFTLADTNGKAVSLSQLLAARDEKARTTPKGVLLIFYRGYW